MVDLSAWQITEKDFPRGGSDADKLEFCIRYAVLAPSTYNTQPWHFVIEQDQAHLFADRRYAVPVIDPDDREMSMACAAALFNLKLAIRYFGLSEVTTLLPDKEQPDLYASVKLAAQPAQSLSDADKENDQALFKAITKRHTNRGAFLAKEVPEDILRGLQSAASSEGASLHFCNQEERELVIRLIAEGDHIQSGDKHFRRELAAWTDPRRIESHDGLPQLKLQYKDIMTNLTPTIARRFEVEQGRPANDQELDAGAPVIAILGTARGGLLQRLNVGQAWMRVLLEAERNGLSVSFLNQPCEVPELRLMLHDELAQHGRAHIIMRIGYGAKPSFTARRPLDQVVTRSKRGKSVVSEPKMATKGGLFGKMKKLLKK